MKIYSQLPRKGLSNSSITNPGPGEFALLCNERQEESDVRSVRIDGLVFVQKALLELYSWKRNSFIKKITPLVCMVALAHNVLEWF